MSLTQEEQDYVQRLEDAYMQEKAKNPPVQSATSMYQTPDDQNLIQWQLELDNVLERIDHLLRGHELKFDKEGNSYWDKPKNEDKVLLNDYGVQEVLRVLSMYLNRNTILSNYDEETINWKVYDFGIDISDLLFMKYEQMGLDTPQKLKHYTIICTELVNTVHSTYLRALNGGERESLRTARQVHQSEPIGDNYNYPRPQSKFSLNPLKWGR